MEASLQNQNPSWKWVTATLLAPFWLLLQPLKFPVFFWENQPGLSPGAPFGILGGCLCGFWIGIPVSSLMEKLGELISWGTQQQPLVMGITLAVFMGMACTFPLNAAALAAMLQLSGLAAGAATIGCCCNMIGFALAGYKDNGIFGLLAVGLGTSKLQFPKILQRPLIWLPSLLSSAILGP